MFKPIHLLSLESNNRIHAFKRQQLIYDIVIFIISYHDFTDRQVVKKLTCL